MLPFAAHTSGHFPTGPFLTPPPSPLPRARAVCSLTSTKARAWGPFGHVREDKGCDFEMLNAGLYRTEGFSSVEVLCADVRVTDPIDGPLCG